MARDPNASYEGKNQRTPISIKQMQEQIKELQAQQEAAQDTITQLYSDLKNYATIAGAQALINKSYNKMNIYYVGTDSKTTIKLKCTSTTTGAHIWGFLFMEQNGNPFAAILTPYRGMSELINYKGWKCTYSEPEYTITANAWSYGFFLTVETFEISYE